MKELFQHIDKHLNGKFMSNIMEEIDWFKSDISTRAKWYATSPGMFGKESRIAHDAYLQGAIDQLNIDKRKNEEGELKDVCIKRIISTGTYTLSHIDDGCCLMCTNVNGTIINWPNNLLISVSVKKDDGAGEVTFKHV